jgi:pyridoxal phosphate enzyme (YggS family)
MSDVSKRLLSLQDQIDCAKRHAKIFSEKIEIIAVSKYATVEQIKALYDAGQRSFAEGRIAAALEKIAQLPKDISWHFIGPIQSNKINKMIGIFSLIHSVASYKVAQLLSEKSKAQGVVQKVLLQVNISQESTKQGFLKHEILCQIKDLMQLPGLQIIGLMTMGPLSDDQDKIRLCFQELKQLQKQLYTSGYVLDELSMGMSHDFSLAIEEGSTMVRIGSFLFS